MSGFFYEEPSIWLFALVTVILGGGAAWMSGRAVALTWRPYWQVLVYMLLLACAVRFLHFALFQGTLLTLQYYFSDLVVLLILGSISFRFTRASQMASQYPWLYERVGPFAWKQRKPAA